MDRRTLVGEVISVKMQKTVVVLVERKKRHPLYRRTIRRTKHYFAHDEHNQCVLGDVVRLVESRPLSKLKRWRVVDIIKRGDVPEVAPSEIDAPEVGSS
ncbi:MAG: 30S ribosomal protein S17 [Dehalococcoidia bacterium]|nr:30S ribosomal protein S17 [Dehalococcoidia bacterium]